MLVRRVDQNRFTEEQKDKMPKVIVVTKPRPQGRPETRVVRPKPPPPRLPERRVKSEQGTDPGEAKYERRSRRERSRPREQPYQRGREDR